MNRRLFIAGAIAAIVKTGKPEEWLIIADDRPNLNRHRYTLQDLQSMAATAKGMLVSADESGPIDGGDLKSAMGVCSEARMVGARLECRFQWFTASHPIGKAVTPNGMGSLYEVAGGFQQIKDYRLCSFSLNEHSAFESATAVPSA
jgi:hypothetical protein